VSLPAKFEGFCHVGSETQPSQPARTPAFRLVAALRPEGGGYGSYAAYGDDTNLGSRSAHNRYLMNDIEVIERDLRTRFPGATVTIDAPSDPAAIWYVDVRDKQHALTLQWRRDRGFGVSTAPGGYGEGAEEHYSTVAQVEERVAELLHPMPAAR
jgi:hypothetical protein